MARPLHTARGAGCAVCAATKPDLEAITVSLHPLQREGKLGVHHEVSRLAQSRCRPLTPDWMHAELRKTTCKKYDESTGAYQVDRDSIPDAKAHSTVLWGL